MFNLWLVPKGKQLGLLASLLRCRIWGRPWVTASSPAKIAWVKTFTTIMVGYLKRRSKLLGQND